MRIKKIMPRVVKQKENKLRDVPYYGMGARLQFRAYSLNLLDTTDLNYEDSDEGSWDTCKRLNNIDEIVLKNSAFVEADAIYKVHKNKDNIDGYEFDSYKIDLGLLHKMTELYIQSPDVTIQVDEINTYELFKAVASDIESVREVNEQNKGLFSIPEFEFIDKDRIMTVKLILKDFGYSENVIAISFKHNK